MKYLLCLLIIFAIGCTGGNPPTLPGGSMCVVSPQHSWGDARGTYHLAHDAWNPVLSNQTNYFIDTGAWNALKTPIQFRTSGDGFTIHMIEEGDEHSGWLGLASVILDSAGHITHAVVSMNRTLLERYNSPNMEAHVACQEAGHTLGLDHHVALDSCMDDCTKASDWRACINSPLNMGPNAHDGEQLNIIYGEGHHDPKPPSTCFGKRIIIHELTIPEGQPGHIEREGHDH